MPNTVNNSVPERAVTTPRRMISRDDKVNACSYRLAYLRMWCGDISRTVETIGI